MLYDLMIIPIKEVNYENPDRETIRLYPEDQPPAHPGCFGTFGTGPFCSWRWLSI
jgi:hypothetical protein